MKPTKIRRFCQDCGRMKAVFDSEGAAKRFIEYNSEDIENTGGYAPKRVYYCDLCCGWHVTSHTHYDHKTNYRKRVDAIMEMQRAQAEMKKKRKANPQFASVTPFMSEAMRMAFSAVDHAMKKEVDEAQKICAEIFDLFYKMSIVPITGAPKLRRNFKKVLEQFQGILNQETPPSKSKVVEIAQLFEEQKNKAPGFYCYEPAIHTDQIYEVTPANIDEWLQMPNIEKQNSADKAHEERLKYQDIQWILEAAEASIACGDMEEAKASLMQAIDETQLLERGEYREHLTTEINRVANSFQSALSSD